MSEANSNADSTHGTVGVMKVLALALLCVLSVAVAATLEDSSAQTTGMRDDRAARAAFTEAFKVFAHPLCLNCHPAGDSPLRGADNQPHSSLRLRRGPDGQGVSTRRLGGVPWRLPQQVS